MLYSPDEEARFELALSTSILNELKYGSQLDKLAQDMLSSAFRSSSVDGALHQQIAKMLPTVRYVSLAAFLNGGVVIRSTNLVTEGAVIVRAQAMGQSAARIAAKQHSIFHGQKKAGEPIKFQELQEAWDQQECTSTVSVPIPASRHFEDAFIPYADRDQPPADRGTCPVLYAANGTVGVLHFGLSTGDVKLNGSQGRQFVGLAQSFGPHLGYLIAPALEALQPQIQAVATTLSAQQEMRRRSVSCALPPVEQLTVHDSAESLTRQLPSRFRPGSQQTRRAAIPSGQQPSPRMLSPFQTYTAPASVSPQGSNVEAQSPEAQPSDQQPDCDDSVSSGSGRLDLSPAKTALDMSLLDVAKLGSPYKPQPRIASDSASSVMRQRSGEPHRRLSAGESQTAAKVAEKAEDISRRSTHSRELEMEAQPSTELYAGPHEVVIAGSNRGRGHRRPPLPLMRASSPLAVHGSDLSSDGMPRQMSIHLPDPVFLAKQQSADRSPSKLSQDSARHWEAAQKGFDNFAAGHRPINTATSGGSAGSFTSPFASSQPSGDFPDTDEPHPAASIATTASTSTTASSLMPEGSVINMASLLPSQASQQRQQQGYISPHRLSPLAVASLGASLPSAISSPAMAVLSAPMTALQPTAFEIGPSGLTVPSLPPSVTTSMQAHSPPQHPLPSSFVEQRQDSQQTGYRLPPQLQSSSLLLQLLPAGSAQSLTALMSRQASGASLGDPRPISRSSSLTNEGSTSVSLSSPKRSLLNMSRAVSEQLHLAPGSKAVQRPFLADLQQRWTAGTQNDGGLSFFSQLPDPPQSSAHAPSDTG